MNHELIHFLELTNVGIPKKNGTNLNKAICNLLILFRMCFSSPWCLKSQTRWLSDPKVVMQKGVHNQTAFGRSRQMRVKTVGNWIKHYFVICRLGLGADPWIFEISSLLCDPNVSSFRMFSREHLQFRYRKLCDFFLWPVTSKRRNFIFPWRSLLTFKTAFVIKI